jgi:beta-N-acetylhexosaminidase
VKPALIGLAGPALTADEAALLRSHPPAGVILFARNIQDPPQLAALVAALRRLLPADALLMVDQEGGRVARLRPPHWRAHPPAAAFGACAAADPDGAARAAWCHGALIGAEAAAAGFDVVTAPVLDRRLPGASDVIGDRAFGADPALIARLGRAMAEGLLAAGVQPVMKHAPGHGRATADSHLALPVVAGGDPGTAPATDHVTAPDLAPFALNADLPWAMTAHILFPAWDAALPATLSPAVIGRIIRGRIGFMGVLVTDDLAMRALSGAPADLARAALAAGCDLALYCSGEIAATAALLDACPPFTPAAAARLAAARALATDRRRPLDQAALAAERDRLLASRPIASRPPA